ncbi:pectinesterase family protein [Vibrio nitrifigilis]|uniref:Pectin esterase n=1 Tax=Vibrio nitrifigilis TaxID=2789781 RepID=A0ABS0GLA4_9VIBR|nr:pectinesterase family protein [Vibrio nitrifigilis]MBF9003228.1 pectin esterase [Vibrio nitrifigilis]
MKLNRVTLACCSSALFYFSSANALPLYNVSVAADGSADYSSIQAALDNAPNDQSDYVVYIHDGVYHEKLNITRPNTYLIGQNRDKTIITATTANGMLQPNGKKFGTFGSRTVAIDADGVKIRSLTIANGFDFNANQAKSDQDQSKVKNTQAVALLVSNHADKAELKDVNLVGYQDTLYLRAGRSFIDQSQISGNIDFIFGLGTALIKDSNIVARNRNDVAAGEPYGYITAPATNINDPFGIVFKHCRLTKESGVPANSYGLGRPWHPTTTFKDGRYADPNAVGNTTFINCDMDDHIYGWDKMSGHDKNNHTIWFYPQQSRFWEFGNRGPGAKVATARPQLTTRQAKAYSDEQVLSGWQPDISLARHSLLQGEVLHRSMVFPAQVTVKDSLGKTITTTTDQKGHYRVSVKGMTAPLLVNVDDHSGESCLTSVKRRSMCVAALVVKAKNGGTTTGNVNPFSDLIVSVMAHQAGLLGPQELVAAKTIPAMAKNTWVTANQHFDHAFANILGHYGLDAKEEWDPVSYSSLYHPLMADLASQVLHNRGYDTKTGLAKGTTLTDLAFKPIISLDSNPIYYLSYNQLSDTQQAVKSKDTRVFIVGDSTASYYEPDAFPRTGWGQAFHALVGDNGKVMVVNAARSGRSSKDYINGRWLSLLEPLVKPGDYLFIQFSHNDEKCDGSKPGRGPLDVANLCTYPNNARGEPQFPVGHPEMSLQHELEQYIAFARQHKMHPVFLTSLPRAKMANGHNGLPLNPIQHVTKQNTRHGYAFVGSYTDTVKQTAQRYDVPLIDIQKQMIAIANKEGNWKSMWLAVNTDKYPYYVGRTGRFDKPDTTHFQLRGATMAAEQVLKDIKQQPELKALAMKL